MTFGSFLKATAMYSELMSVVEYGNREDHEDVD